ncbi:ATP-dependent RNA helicase RhlE [Flavobacterium fontis]|uniref:ATP-dependent RNA helicase RhlE n=1 Tax=Flavobacterium fontis TaxID=1124188 RepID=A0A1M5CAC0_9FLAO|nr:DEAD/DEAH box helicase [Flavobacterium fontis]SHF51714.1 ATP-dependent RNA helicase RhlE [Flavobacterium fontis]
MTFQDFSLLPVLQKAITEAGYTQPSLIQQKAIPLLLQGHDLIGCAQTGTGKTAAFVLPILQQLTQNKPTTSGQIRVLVVTPTRELTLQVEATFTQLGSGLPFRSQPIFGGVSEGKQIQALHQKPAIIVATPGRLLDLLRRNLIDLRHLEALVLDEADRMLDMGFIHDMKALLRFLPQQRQTLFFTATFPDTIRKLIPLFLNNPMQVDAQPVSSIKAVIEQAVYVVEPQDKEPILLSVLRNHNGHQCLLFTKTKHGANKLVQKLSKQGVTAAAIHGNKSQSARQKALADFKAQTIQVMVATDIAARGIDIEALPLVINYDLPTEVETYVHRIGRTGRAGLSGQAISFCTPNESAMWRQIVKQNGKPIHQLTH